MMLGVTVTYKCQIFLNKKEQEKKNAPESNGSLVVGENQKVKVINSQEKIFFQNFKDRKFQEKNSNS